MNLEGLESNGFNKLGAEKFLNKVHIKIVPKYFWKNILCSFEAEDMQFGQYSKNYNCIPLPIILESKTKKELVDKIKSLKNKLYLITCETLENPTIAKMLKKCMLKSVDFHNLLITMNPCCRSVKIETLIIKLINM